MVVARKLGAANLSARQSLAFYHRRNCPRVKSKQPQRSERSVDGSSWLGTNENGQGEAEGRC